jgi:tetratricopeptide (TPR) repeat protein
MDLGADAGLGRWSWSNLAVGAVIVMAAVIACQKIANEDIPWHLASGQWMLEHGRVLDHDPFSTHDAGTAGDKPWVNVHWGFQVLVAGLHKVGGYWALVGMKMLVLGGFAAVLALGLRRLVPPAWLILCVGLTVLAIQVRVRARPEIFTFLFLALTLVIVDSVRRGGSARRLWWLALINILWVNMHGVFIVGIVAAWSAVGGAWLDRLLGRSTAGGLAKGAVLGPMLAATLACLASPWPIEAATHPLLLLTRISGEQAMYSFGVSEFMPSYMANPLGAPYMLLVIVMAIVTLEAMQLRWRQVPLGHVLWFVVFLVPAITAVRNQSLFAIVLGFLLALHGGQWLREVAQRRPAWGKVSAPATALMLLLTAVVAVAFATEWAYRWQKMPYTQFGFGHVTGNHPTEMAQALGQWDIAGDVLPLEFGDGGTFIYYSWPKRKVWMDGRLEAHSAERFEKYYEIRTKMLSAPQASNPADLPLPPEVRFIAVPVQDARRIAALTNSPRFRLVYIDPAGACFARIPLGGETIAWPKDEKLPEPNIRAIDLPLDARTGLLVARAGQPALDAPTQRHWYRQNPPAVQWQMGAMLFNLGLDDLAARYLTAAAATGLYDRTETVGLLAQACQRLGEARPLEPEADLPVSPYYMRALTLLDTLDLSDLGNANNEGFALLRVRAMIKACQIDAAKKALDRFLADLPIPRRWSPPSEAVDCRDALEAGYKAALRQKGTYDFTGLLPGEKALLLTRKEMGLIDEAIAVLADAHDLTPRQKLLLGDLYLREGKVADARRTYRDSGIKADDWALTMRLGLCDWADGQFAAAIEKLTSAADSPKDEQGSARVYLGLLYEQLGDYASAAKVLEDFRKSPAGGLKNQHAAIMDRLKTRLASISPPLALLGKG